MIVREIIKMRQLVIRRPQKLLVGKFSIREPIGVHVHLFFFKKHVKIVGQPKARRGAFREKLKVKLVAVNQLLTSLFETLFFRLRFCHLKNAIVRQTMPKFQRGLPRRIVLWGFRMLRAAIAQFPFRLFHFFQRFFHAHAKSCRLIFPTLSNQILSCASWCCVFLPARYNWRYSLTAILMLLSANFFYSTACL